MKTISTIRFKPKPAHFDLVADKLKERADHWATRGTTAKVYLVQDIEDNYEVEFYENKKLVETRQYWKSSREWGETVAEDAAENWCLGYIP